MLKEKKMKLTELQKTLRVEVNYELGPYMTFSQSKTLPIHRWFWYKEGFSPRLFDYFYKGEKSVADPFCGVGTTLLAAKERGVASFGSDISPLAVFVSTVKCREYGKEVAQELLGFLKKSWRGEAEWRFELFPPQRAFPPRNYREIVKVRAALEEEREEVRNLLLLALLSVLPRVGIFRKDGGVLKIERKKKAMPFREAFRRKVKQIVEDLGKIKGPLPHVELGDARTVSFDCDLIFTSPPYLNNIDYSKVYGLELSLLTLDERSTERMRAAALRSFITKKSGYCEVEEAVDYAHLPIVGAYFKDMERFLRTISSRAVIILSNAVIHNTYIPVDEIVARIALRLGFRARIVVGAERIADVKPKRIKVRESVVEICL